MKGRIPVALGGGHVFHDHFQHGADVDAVLRGDFRSVLGGQADDVLDLRLGLGGPGGGQVDFVDDGEHLQPRVDGEIGVGQCLSLHALAGVHHQHGPLAGGKAPGHLVVKIHMARGVNEVQIILLSIVGGVAQLDGSGLDGDAPLPL